MAAAKGNNYAGKEHKWAAAIERALARRSKVEAIEALDELAEVLLQQCAKGDMVALKELGDRLDGKATQKITGENGGPIIVIHKSE